MIKSPNLTIWSIINIIYLKAQCLEGKDWLREERKKFVDEKPRDGYLSDFHSLQNTSRLEAEDANIGNDVKKLQDGTRYVQPPKGVACCDRRWIGRTTFQRNGSKEETREDEEGSVRAVTYAFRLVKSHNDEVPNHKLCRVRDNRFRRRASGLCNVNLNVSTSNTFFRRKYLLSTHIQYTIYTGCLFKSYKKIPSKFPDSFRYFS